MDIEWLIYHLIHNDDDQFTSIVDLDVDLCRWDLDQWDRLLIGFSRNRTVTSIELSRGYQQSVVTEDDLQNLFAALRKLPKLSKVKLDSFTTYDLEQTRSLFLNNDIIEDLWIENTRCEYEEESPDAGDDEDDEGNDHIYYEHFLGYLATMSRNSLRHLRIVVPEKLSHCANITALLNGSSKLESLVIETTSEMSPAVTLASANAPSEEDRLRNFATSMAALESNFVLKTLDMDFRLSFADFKHVAIMLKHNRTLTHLCLRLDTTQGTLRDAKDGTGYVVDHDPHFEESIELFFDALKTNTSSALKSFSQYQLNDEKLQTAVSDVRVKPRVANSAPDITYAERAKILVDLGLDMLHCNLSLEFFSFFLFYPNNSDPVKKKQMFLRLNERGRRLVRHRDISESVPKSTWVDQLSKHSMDDLDGLYYYISANPSICKLEHEGDTTRYTLKDTKTIAALDDNNRKSKREKASEKESHELKETTGRDSSSPTTSNPNEDSKLFIEGPETKRQRVDDDITVVIPGIIIQISD